MVIVVILFHAYDVLVFLPDFKLLRNRMGIFAILIFCFFFEVKLTVMFLVVWMYLPGISCPEDEYR